jgi:hypothetical protein
MSVLLKSTTGRTREKNGKRIDKTSAQTWRLQGGLSSVNSQWPAYQIVSCYPSHVAEKKKMHFISAFAFLHFRICGRKLYRDSLTRIIIQFSNFLTGCIFIAMCGFGFGRIEGIKVLKF